jgi:ankyrin repeat protein
MTSKVVERDSSGQTLLHHACNDGDIQKVLELLEFGADIACHDSTGWTPLHNAALNGHASVVEILLRYGADVDPLGFEDETPLHDAVANGHLECASLLLKYGAEPFRKNKNGRMPIELVREGDSALRELLEYPLEHWQPLKTPEFYPRLLTPCDPNLILEKKKKLDTKAQKESSVKKHSQKAAKHHHQTNSFSWGGLDDRSGPFESSREEKKFRALWQTIAKQDTVPTRANNGDSPSVSRGRQSSAEPMKPKSESRKRGSISQEDSIIKKSKK